MEELTAPMGAQAGLTKVFDVPGAAVLKLTGELDLSNADSVHASIAAVVGGRDTLVFDLGELRFMDSSGLAMLVALSQELEGKIEPLNPSPRSGRSSSSPAFRSFSASAAEDRWAGTP